MTISVDLSFDIVDQHQKEVLLSVMPHLSFITDQFGITTIDPSIMYTSLPDDVHLSIVFDLQQAGFYVDISENTLVIRTSDIVESDFM